MKWREVGKVEDQQPKPSLESVLDHYGVRYTTRRSQMTHCPFHEDRTPSLSLDLERGLWRCHSCGKRGDSYNMIMEKEGVTFGRARDIASSLRLADGGAGGGGQSVSESTYGRRRTVPSQSGDRQGTGKYVPSWRRR